ncbi:MAG: DUF6516 family protein [Rhizobium sp.]|nr:DUF6516 family protein [Rhizobium sp.]MCZ8351593.1 DUF6516 family protein [Rhizobium sp.]
MKADKQFHEKRVLGDGAIIEMVIWRLPSPVLGSIHHYKYQLYFGRAGIRIVGFDNERGKGDHKHIDGVETPYVFTTVDQLVADFLNEVKRRLDP